LWVIFALLDPDPDPEYGSGSIDPIESDPIRIRIRNLLQIQNKKIGVFKSKTKKIGVFKSKKKIDVSILQIQNK
jgi:hypothetical protein